jgi:hypothetical protein
VRRKANWRRWKGTFPDGLLDVCAVGMRLVSEAAGDDSPGVPPRPEVRAYGRLVLTDGRDIQWEGLNGLAHWLEGQRPPLGAKDIQSLSMHIGDAAEGVGMVVSFSRKGWDAVDLVVLGTATLSVPGVFHEMQQWLNRGKRLGSRWPKFRTLHVLTASLWVVIVGAVLTFAVSEVAGLIVVGVAALMLLAAILMEYVLPLAVPQLELLPSTEQPTRSAGWLKSLRQAGLFLAGAAAGAVISQLVGGLL